MVNFPYLLFPNAPSALWSCHVQFRPLLLLPHPFPIGIDHILLLLFHVVMPQFSRINRPLADLRGKANYPLNTFGLKLIRKFVDSACSKSNFGPYIRFPSEIKNSFLLSLSILEKNVDFLWFSYLFPSALFAPSSSSSSSSPVAQFRNPIPGPICGGEGGKWRGPPLLLLFQADSPGERRGMLGVKSRLLFHVVAPTVGLRC